MKAIKSISPKNAATSNETRDNVKSEWEDQPRVNRLDWEDPPNPKRPKLETVGDCRGPAWISPGEGTVEDRLLPKQELVEPI